MASLDDGQRKPYFVMPLLPGKTLDKLIRGARHRLTVDRVVEIISQTCRGLQAAHLAGLIHHDLKPSNLFVMNAIRTEFPPAISDINPAVNKALAQVVAKALAKGPWNGPCRYCRRTHWVTAVMVKPYVRGLGSNLLDREPLKYVWIDTNWRPDAFPG